jgi:hypothetical protein
MSAILSAVATILCLALSVEAQSYHLGIYDASTRRIDSAAAHEVRQEIQRLLTPAGIEVGWQDAQRSNSTVVFHKLAIASFDGECAVNELPSTGSISPQKNKLADTVLGKEGRVRPFFDVDCNRLILALRPLLDRVNVPMRNIILGRAIARVMAHEVYHIVAQTTDHAEVGVAKESLSREDLIAEHFDFSQPSLDRMRREVNK